MLDAIHFEEIKATGNLPSPRGVALEIIRLTQTDTVTIAQLARVIQSDPALTGRLLKAANSPVLGVRRPIVTVSDAVTMLGLPMVRQLALSFSLVSHYRTGSTTNPTSISFDYDAYWQDALLTGVAAQAIAAQIQIVNAEELFILGLLAQVGRLALATLYGTRYSTLVQQNAAERDTIAAPEALESAERAVFQVTHGELTGALLLDWGIPRGLCLAVEAHETPEASPLAPDSREKRMALALNLAWKLALLLRAAKHQPPDRLPQASQALIMDAAKIGIDANRLTVLMDTTLVNWAQWAAIMEVATLTFDAPVLFSNTGIVAPISATVNPQAMRVLVVDDDPLIVLEVQKLLSAAGHEVAIACNGQEALELAFKFYPEVLICDWLLPQMDGLQLVKVLRETRTGQGIYILFLTGLEQEDKLVEAFAAGVDDYLLKPLMPRVLIARVQAGQRFIQQRKELTQELEQIRSVAAELAVNNRTLQQAALTDSLTGLPNRRYAMERLQQELSTARRRSGGMSLILLDVDYFKRVNDTHGQTVGDQVLCHVAGLLRAKARLQDAICRMDGEEFLIICPDTGTQDAARCAERLRSTLNETPFVRDHLKIDLTASLGVATTTESVTSADLVTQAGRAVYRAKAEGRNRVVLALKDAFPRPA